MTKVGLAVHRTFHSVRHSRNFRLFFFGQAVSVTGTWVQYVASLWLVLQMTGSGIALGVVTALSFAPILVIGAWAGVLADRFDKRRILLLTQSSFAVLALALGALVATGLVQLWMVYILSLLQGIVTAIDNPARHSFFAEMVGSEHLTNAVSLNSAVMTGTRIIGPALAGLLIASVGIAACFLVNGVSYVAVIGGLLAMRSEDLHRTTPPPDGGGLRSGLRYVWGTHALRLPLIVAAVLFTFSFNFTVLLPLLAERSFGGDAGTLGLLLSLMGAGSLIGALAMARGAKPNERRLAVSAGLLGAVTIAAAFSPTLPIALAGMAILGLVSIVFMITANTTLQLSSRPEMRGRVMALYSVVFLGGTPIGAPIAGWTAERFGPRMGLALGGLVAVAVGFAAWSVVRRHGLGPLVPTAQGEEA
ncbi:MAG TPA: MFS transporter [Actinomycetota bacterium]|nr:MFS transporter [Actinomycetota bacterium]